MSADDVVRARIDSGVKREASEVLARMGLSMSDAVRLMLLRVAKEGALPFDVRLPKETETALEEARAHKGKRFKSIATLMDDLNT